MAVYSYKYEDLGGDHYRRSLTLDEQHIYGSSRHAMSKPAALVYGQEIELTPGDFDGEGHLVGGYSVLSTTDNSSSPYQYTITRGKKYYEVGNHLGNVMSTLRDYKIPQESSGDILNFTPDVSTWQDYLPFGMLMYHRHGDDGGEYRYGFEKQEVDIEVYGEGNYVNFKYRGYNPRIARFFAVDPLAKKFPHMTPYQFAGNKPIWSQEIEGLESLVDAKGKVIHHDKKDKDLRVFMKDGDKLKQIGMLGGDIDINTIFGNVLKDNADASYKQTPIGWYFNVKEDGDWDYKNNESTIFGMAWSYDESKKKINPDAKKTNFLYLDFGYDGIFNAADVGNYNAGWTGTHTGIPLWLQKVGAGHVEQLKQDFNGTMWNPMQYFEEVWMDKYFGDRPTDYYWNEKGMKDAKKDMETNPRILR